MPLTIYHVLPPSIQRFVSSTWNMEVPLSHTHSIVCALAYFESKIFFLVRTLQYISKIQIFFLPLKTWKNRTQKLLIIGPFFSELPKGAWSAQTVENWVAQLFPFAKWYIYIYSFFNVSYTWYKSLLAAKVCGLNHLNVTHIFTRPYASPWGCKYDIKTSLHVHWHNPEKH